MICKCYTAEKNFLGKVGTCWGTAERDACSCGGDKSKCDFYPNVREEEKKPVTNYDRIRAMTDEELADELLELFACFYAVEWSREQVLDLLKQEATNDP
jgi:hypothetical protein